MERCRKFELLEGLEHPCADISYHWRSDSSALLTVTLHFSRVTGGYPDDVDCRFRKPVALLWEDESYSVSAIPGPLPKVENPNFDTWTYPSITIEESSWAESGFSNMHQAIGDGELTHFVFVSMNDVLHVLAVDIPEVLASPIGDA